MATVVLTISNVTDDEQVEKITRTVNLNLVDVEAYVSNIIVTV